MVDGPNGNGAVHEAATPMPELELRALEAEATVMLSRLRFMRQAGVSFKGARDLYLVLGYDDDITTEQYRARYERGGIAGTIVDVMVDATWRGGMELIEDEDPEAHTPFEAAWQELEERLNLSTYMIRADRLSRLSEYAVMLIGTSLNGDLTTELPKGKPENLIFLQPYSGSGGPTRDGRQPQNSSSDARAKVEAYDTDTKSPRYGQPSTYSLRLDDGGWKSGVHHSRIIHVAENCLDDDVFGRSALKRTWNLLDDLDKVTGGGAEAFFLRANQGLHFDVNKDMESRGPDGKSDLATVLADLKKQSEAYKHQMDRWIRTKGVDVKTLGSDVANFANPADAVLKQIAGATRIPARILTGSEMGELASSQDRENFKDQVNGRQEQHAGPNLVRKLADRLIQFGYLPEPKEGPRKYTVKWAHIQTMTEQEKTTGAKDWAAVNAAYGSVVFTDSEIREKWADKAPLSDEQKKEIADAAEEKAKQAQAMMEATKPAEEPGAFPRAAEDAEILRVLEAAIVAGNAEVINKIIGLQDGPHKLSSTQIDLPDATAKHILSFEIVADDIYELEGREDRPHVTVKYGLPADASAPNIAGFGSVRLTLGLTDMFATPDYDVLFVSVMSLDLVRLHSVIAPDVEDTHSIYTPHATIAYLKSGRGAKYIGRRVVEEDAATVTVETMTFVKADGEREQVSLA